MIVTEGQVNALAHLHREIGDGQLEITVAPPEQPDAIAFTLFDLYDEAQSAGYIHPEGNVDRIVGLAS